MIKLFKIRSMLSITMLFLSFTAFATEKTVNVVINPVGLALGYFSLGGEFKLNNKWSAGADFGYIKLSRHGNKYRKYRGFGGSLRANYAIGNGQTFKNSWFISPLVSISKVNAKENSAQFNNAKSTANCYLLGALYGYQWFADNGFNVSLGFGPGYGFVSKKSKSANSSTFSDLKRLVLIGELKIGFAF